MAKIAFIGPQDLHGLFKSVGMDVFDCEGGTVGQVLVDLAEKGCQVIYIVESLARDVIDAIEELMRERGVSVVIMRDHRSRLGLGMELDRRAAVDAVGTDAIFSTGEGK